jgi:hypothetical protein
MRAATAEFQELAGTPVEPRAVRVAAEAPVMPEVPEPGATRPAERPDWAVLAAAAQAMEATGVKEKVAGAQPWCGYPKGSASTRPR